ncbi:colicin V biosynthesis protein [Campylobacterota bacterium]|nr:colicin V biosynthesis protein [Campylobacterota bacterium]
MTTIHYLDIVVLALVAILGVRGFFTGFIREVFSLIGFLMGFVIASRLALFVGQWAGTYLHFASQGAMKLAGFAALFVLIWLFFFLIGMLLARIIRRKNGGIVRKTALFFDRLGGFVICALKVFVIFAVIIAALSQTAVVANWAENKLQDSFMYPTLKIFGGALMSLEESQIGEKVSSGVREGAEQITNAIADEAAAVKDSIDTEIDKAINE